MEDAALLVDRISHAPSSGWNDYRGYEQLDPATYREVGDIRIGETLVELVWLGPVELIIPVSTWAMSLAHAAKLLEVWGLQMSSNEILAFAVEESALGCDETIDTVTYHPETERNGCFNIDGDFDFAELQALFPGRFARSHADTVGGANFEASALTFAFLVALHDAELEAMGYATGQFYRDADDPDALIKVAGVTHALGADNGHTERIFDSQRAYCVAEPDLAKEPVSQACISNSGTSGYVRSVTDHAYALGSPSAPIYDAELRWTDVLAYMDAISSVYPEAASSSVRAQVRATFDSQAGTDGIIDFADGFGSVLDTLILALPAPENIQAAVDLTGAYAD